ncbi:MAG: hypothetical protein GW762_05630 [Candidatus Pacebacteria bacterium]|nr:hypothetical protein [Candidatus Paceibacterota bacterium]PIR63616.1 MAG: hypothetical protein COU64_03400 [Candidatus Pacebacteria bacterium CG10_big_fil_rev_8_21_14_0_10_40_26]PIZ78718.1 MAG: hypothetical protein COY01_03770 [Candidatus Pacebacteria bacterium CG_4_10_14_0_2_um_filter_40_20]PJA68430.1 MAG: hypothetical protein CO156_05545 [Candidatus Pacebacteria bacterium CG_4_9_14_3_um_filter_40_12]PJC41292.1 MAG: hypothetical protein CO041_05615 [Candidatus Pacebacteria bacterium CG_4_9_
MNSSIVVVKPQSFSPHKHWYSKALNAQIHPVVSFFMNMDNERIIQRFSYLNPSIDAEYLRDLLKYTPKYFKWAGTDLMHTTTTEGMKQMVVIETNSCPSGQKSFPLLDENNEKGGYEELISKTFLPIWKKSPLKKGVTCVVYDKNPMENSGYAATIADLIKKDVYLVEYHEEDYGKCIRFNSETRAIELLINDKWTPVRTIFRYVTQKPWNRLPLFSKTRIFNPIIACLAGGRNKLMAAKAYDFLNAEVAEAGLEIKTPTTIWDVNKNEIPLWLEKFGYKGVIKIPYSNAGQGVFTIINEKELEAFMDLDIPYQKFIIQRLVGHYAWSTYHENELLFQVGTIPSKRQNSYVFDLRMLVHTTENGLRPLGLYSRKAEEPLTANIAGKDSKNILMTNLSVKKGEHEWDSDTSRLLLMDQRDFNKLGLSLDDLIEGYVQSVLAMIAIDKMAKRLVTTKKTFRRKLFTSLNDDETLLNELFKEK